MSRQHAPGTGIFTTNTTKLTAAYSALQLMQMGDMLVSTDMITSCDPARFGYPSIAPEDKLVIDKSRIAEARRQFTDYMIVPTASGRGITVSGKRLGKDDAVSAAMWAVLSFVFVQKSEGISRGADREQEQAYAHLRRLVRNEETAADTVRG
jgi:hypothetical protein